MTPFLAAYLLLAPQVQELPPPVPVSAPTTTAPLNVPTDYKLDTDDVLQIEVDRHSYLNRAVRIPVDGALRLPRLLTPIPVRGLTCADVVEKLTEALEKEGKLRLRKGQVQVALAGIRMRRIYIRGNATFGRDLDLRNGWRVTELLTILGGIPQPDRITVRLLNPARPAPLTLDITGILKNPDHPQNVFLLEGDTLTMDQPLRKRLFIKGEGPRGLHEIDERFGLRAVLAQFGYSVVNASGDLHHVILKRKTIPGEINSPETTQKLDLYALLTDETIPEIPLQDLDTLEIPLSLDFVYVWGELGGSRKYPLPQDRKTYLQDIMANASITTGQARIGAIKIARLGPDGKYTLLGEFDWGKYLKDFKPERNPEIKPQDLVYVPSVRHADPSTVINQIVGGVQGLFFLRSIFKL
ncbi:polysaccharide biosynthesis/export family protein [Armatimonas sp.]|uniref:polysaccharide biosynthesis/export family protein n=1 Tax=Armatimonas sp. TaxID=1872638 RepID=UPI00286B4EC4|nr:polysaccharide biosynthesis/export family protein [Armatimonas sp.]